MKSRIKPNCKQSYFNSKVSSVNLRFSKSASLLQQFFFHDAKTMQWWNIGFILCDRSFRYRQTAIENQVQFCKQAL